MRYINRDCRHMRGPRFEESIWFNVLLIVAFFAGCFFLGVRIYGGH